MDMYNTINQMRLERKTIFDLPLKVTYYARVSSLKDEQENSIENQIQHFEEYISKNPNWTYVEGYVDRVRGESADNRPNFQQMIEDGKEGLFDLILTKEVSRFARNTIDSLTYTRELFRAGVGVFFQNDNLCTIDPDSELRLTIMSSIAADEVRKLSSRVGFGHKRAIQNGRVLGNGRIYGYDYKDCKLTINEKEADMVRLIFKLYSEGQATRQIERHLYELGYRNRNNNRLNHNTIANIIQNPKYKGYYCGNKVKIIDYRTKEQKFLPQDEWVMYKDETGETVPAIVSEELWDKCNTLFKERSDIVKNREHSFKNKSAFTGKIYCTHDDKVYWRTSFSNSASKGCPIYEWICSEKKRVNAKACPSFAILEWELYEMIGNYFKTIAPNIDKYIDEFTDMLNKIETKSDIRKQINTNLARVERLENRKRKLLETYLDGLISKEDFENTNTEYQEELNRLESDIENFKSSDKSQKQYTNNLIKIKTYIQSMYDPDKKLSKENIDEFVNTLVQKINATPVDSSTLKIEVQLKTGDSSNLKYNRKIKNRKTEGNGVDNTRRSDIMVNPITPERRVTYPRSNMKATGHQINLNYIITFTMEFDLLCS